MEEGDDMPAARPEFTHLSEAEVLKAIEDDGPIAAEVTRLVAALTVRLMASRERHGQAPGWGMRVQVKCPIERVAVLMMAEAGATVASIQ